ncbi:MAG TPA: IS630 transposase-related protein [Micavibrio sp.]|jgi:hypothetical protein
MPGPQGPRKIDLEALAENVEEHSDWMHAERARHFGVSDFCIRHNLKRLRVSRKKMTLCKQRDYMKKSVSSSS